MGFSVVIHKFSADTAKVPMEGTRRVKPRLGRGRIT